MDDSVPKVAEARQRAEAIFDKKVQQDLDFLEQQRQAQQREIERLQRLRSLRLAKEAAERQVQALAGGKPRGRPRRSRLVKAHSET
jgi:energy-coupling factor transporter ATP-binding protein EcfA2